MTDAWFVDQDLTFVRQQMERMPSRHMPEHIHGIGHRHPGCGCLPNGTPDLEWIPALEPSYWVLSANIAIWRTEDEERDALLERGNHTAFFHFQDDWTGRRRLGEVLASLDRLANEFRSATSQHIVYVKSSGWDRLVDGRTTP